MSQQAGGRASSEGAADAVGASSHSAVEETRFWSDIYKASTI